MLKLMNSLYWGVTDLIVSPPKQNNKKRCIEVLTPSPSKCDIIWKGHLCRCKLRWLYHYRQEVWTETHREIRWPYENRGREGSYAATSQRPRGPPEVRRVIWDRVSLTSLRGTRSANLDFRLLASWALFTSVVLCYCSSRRENILSALPHTLRMMSLTVVTGTVLSSLGDLTTVLWNPFR